MSDSQNDYFAEQLLQKLDATDSVFAAYEAQDISAKVGFDFADFADVVPRALDEVRETEEAYREALEGGETEQEHFGDEIADIMFSHINLARHAGLAELPNLSDLSVQLEPQGEPVLTATARIRARIETVSRETEQSGKDFEDKVARMYIDGIRDAINLAISQGFDPAKLLHENVRKYLQRCKGIEDFARKDGKTWADLDRAGEIIAYWKRVKNVERGIA